MLANTGTVSLILYGTFIVITIVALIAAFYHIKTGDIPIDKLDKMIELFKYAIVSIAIATVTLVVADLFREREQDIRELEYFDKYVEDVKKVDGIEERLLLSKYLSIVAPSGEMKESWQIYYDTVVNEYQRYLADRAELEKLEKIETNTSLTEEQIIKKEKAKEAINMQERPLINMNTPVRRPTIYIHYCKSEKQNEASNIRKKLIENFWNAPGIEFREKGCENTIRYFHEEDMGLANEVNTLLDNKFVIKLIEMRAPKGQIELWIGE